jgi:hypothetical protein
MSGAKERDSSTVNKGGAAEPDAEERAREYEIAGNVERKGEKPSPSDRQRGETSGADPAPAIDRDGDR